MDKVKNIAILGSTGSIGTQTLQIIEEHPECFRASVLVAGRRWEELAVQARKFRPDIVIIGDEAHLPPLREALADLPIKVFAGEKAIEDVMALEEIDVVVAALVGYAGLAPVLRAIREKKTIALANKETLVAAGHIVMQAAEDNGVRIIPVDSEHSAIFQCLRGEDYKEADKIILTASGGPFRNVPKEKLRYVTPADALRHPNWNMGAKVTVDSASMMNKGLEMMEASWLFGCPPSRIEIVVHPQSIVHSMVQFVDGSVKAQLGLPDMRIPIRYALGFPRRLDSSAPPMRLEDYSTLTFERPDLEKFPLLSLAFEAMEKGGNVPCVLNAANEIAVEAFLKEKLPFTGMASLVERVMERVAYLPDPDYDAIVATDAEAREVARSVISI